MARLSRDPENLTYAAFVGTIAAVLVVTALVIGAEKVPVLKDWLKATFSHHWVGKGIIGTIVFFAAGLFASGGAPKTEAHVARAGQGVYIFTVTCCIILTIFFFYQTFFHG